MRMLRNSHVLLILLLILTACAAQPDPTPTPTPTLTPTPTPTATPVPPPTARPSALELSRAEDPSQQGYVRLIHAAPDTPTVNLYIERLAVATNLSFGQNTEPTGIVAGTYTARIVPSGSRPDEGPILYEGPLEIPGEQTLLLVLSGSPDALFLTPYPDSQEALTGTQSRITAIHAIPGGPPVVMQQNGIDLTLALDFGQAALPVVLPPGEMALTFQSSDTTLLTYETVLEPQNNYKLVLISDEPGSYQIIETRTRAPGQAGIHALNVATNYGSVAFYLDDESLVNDLPYGRASERQVKTSGIYDVTIYPANADPAAVEPILRTRINASDDDNLLLILLGPADNLRLLTYRENLAETPANQARVAFLNTLPNVARAGLDTSTPPLQQISELGYGQQPDVINLPSEVSYDFQWNTIENGEFGAPIEATENLRFEPGRSYLYLITGRDGPPLILSEQVGFTEIIAQNDSTEDGEISPTSEAPVQLSFINAIAGGLPVTISVNQQPVASALTYGQISEIFTTNAGEYEIVVQIAETGAEIGGQEVEFEPGTTYTIVAYGFGLEEAELIAFPDADIDTATTAPRLRLMNVSLGGETRLGLGISQTSQSTAGSSPFTQAPETENFRRSLSFGIEPVINISDIAPENVSPVGIASTGPHFLYILDTASSEVAGTIGPINLEPGRSYDVIAFEDIDTPRIQGFVVSRIETSD